ncbi:MAG: hypothetical protein R2755_22895 [Acidimicrobiales bacterium]
MQPATRLPPPRAGYLRSMPLDVEPTPRAPRPAVDGGSIAVVAAVFAGFIGLSTLVLQPELIGDRLFALAIGVALGGFTLLVTPRRRRAPADEVEPATPLAEQLEMHHWSLQELERSHRQLAEEVRELRARVNELEGRRPAAPAQGDPVGGGRR